MYFIKNNNFIEEPSVEIKRSTFIKKFLESPEKKVLYIHIPFCKSKCKYCICETRVCNDNSILEEFVYKTIKKQILDYKEVFDNVSFDELYIGGGTPTILNAKLLKQLLGMIPSIKDIPIKSVECSPNTLTDEHLKLFVEYKFSFISMGVQSLQENVCKWQNRYYVSRDELRSISNAIKNTDIYFNYDMICYLGKGDIRDLPGFKEDMAFIMNECQPSSICVHQHHQVEFTTEKTKFLQKCLTELIIETGDKYQCINSFLLEEDVIMDTMFQAQYRLVSEKEDFCHYMWKKFPMVPVKEFDVLGIGFIENIKVKSNVKELVFIESENRFIEIEFQEFVYDDYKSVRKRKGLK